MGRERERESERDRDGERKSEREKDGERERENCLDGRSTTLVLYPSGVRVTNKFFIFFVYVYEL
jgi:hypothetical protein